MASFTPCTADRCTRPACCHVDSKELCYLHAVCLDKNAPKPAFFNIGIAKKQATDLKHIATEVWTDIVDELEEAGKKFMKRQQAAAPAALSSNAASQREVRQGAPAKPTAPRENIWEAAKAYEDTVGTSGGRMDDIFSSKSDDICPRCFKRGFVHYRVVSSAIEASKADTWGSSSRPDRVVRYTCDSCHNEWLIEEG